MKKIILLILVFLMTGCYDYNELNDLEIVSSLLIDYKDNNYTAYLEVINTNETATVGSKFIEGRGTTLEAAINNIYKDSNLMPFFSHMSSLIISENVAKENIEPLFDYLARDTEIKKSFLFFLADDIDSLLEYEAEPRQSLGENLKKILYNNVRYNGKYSSLNLREILYRYLREIPYVIGKVKLIDKDLYLEDTCLFVDNKLQFVIDGPAALLVNMLRGENKTYEIYDDISYLVNGYKLGYKVFEDKIELELSGNIRITSIKDKVDLSSEGIKKLEKEINAKQEKYLLDIINYAKKKNTDIYGFNHQYYLNYPRLIEKDSWKKLDYSVKVDLKISEKGLLYEGLKGD